MGWNAVVGERIPILMHLLRLMKPKRFSVVRSLDGYAEGMGFFMGLSANRPLVIDFEEESCSEDVASHWHVGSCWETITEEEFMANEAANEYVVDDSDAGF